MIHLVLQLLDLAVEGKVVVSFWPRPALQKVPDLQLQLSVGCLQLVHRVQVGRQLIVQVLHGGFLVSRDVQQQKRWTRRPWRP